MFESASGLKFLFEFEFALVCLFAFAFVLGFESEFLLEFGLQ